MPSMCSAVDCRNNARTHRLHRFPSNAERRKLWAFKVRRVDWTPTINDHLCQEHFEEDQYETRRADGKRLLKWDAVPTIFSHSPAKKRRKPPKNRDQTVRPLTAAQLAAVALAHHGYASLKSKAPDELDEPVVPRKRPKDGSNSTASQAVVELVQHGYSSHQLVSESPDKCDVLDELVTELNIDASTGDIQSQPCSPPATSIICSPDIIITQPEELSPRSKKIQQLNHHLMRRLIVTSKNNRRLSREVRRLEVARVKCEEQLKKLFNPDQVAVLGKKSSRGSKWSDETVHKAHQLLLACGQTGYETLLSQGFPLPSLRSLRRHQNACFRF